MVRMAASSLISPSLPAISTTTYSLVVIETDSSSAQPVHKAKKISLTANTHELDTLINGTVDDASRNDIVLKIAKLVNGAATIPGTSTSP
jgi:hypothetical protein